MSRRYTVTFPDPVASFIQAEAAARFTDEPSAIRAIVIDLMTKRQQDVAALQVGQATTLRPQATAQAVPEAASRPPGRPSPANDAIEALRKMNDAEATAYLKEIGYFPADGTDMFDPSSMHDKRWVRHYVESSSGEKIYWTAHFDPDDPEGKKASFKRPAYADQDQFFAAVRSFVKKAARANPNL